MLLVYTTSIRFVWEALSISPGTLNVYNSNAVDPNPGHKHRPEKKAWKPIDGQMGTTEHLPHRKMLPLGDKVACIATPPTASKPPRNKKLGARSG